MSDVLKVKVTNNPPYLWVIGWMFTLGYLLVSPSETMTFWEAIGTLALTYIVWPLFLGAQLAGHGML